MKRRTFEEAMQHRRSYYSLCSDSLTLDEEIIHAIRQAVKHVPSAFNSQSTRIVLLLGEHHRKLWELVKSVLKKLVPETAFPKTVEKIDRSFAAGRGTVLFYEDNQVIETLQKNYPLYSDNFPVWAQHTSAMHQFVVWTMLEDMGLGASLQHYNPLIDDEVRAAWALPHTWQLVAQMPFGLPLEEPKAKEFQDVSERIRIFE
ncbi:MAG: nitroreductase family protein [Bacteroides sp.]|nr:nitroreductase family protein [Bacteroides sp.]